MRQPQKTGLEVGQTMHKLEDTYCYKADTCYKQGAVLGLPAAYAPGCSWGPSSWQLSAAKNTSTTAKQAIPLHDTTTSRALSRPSCNVTFVPHQGPQEQDVVSSTVALMFIKQGITTIKWCKISLVHNFAWTEEKCYRSWFEYVTD